MKLGVISMDSAFLTRQPRDFIGLVLTSSARHLDKRLICLGLRKLERIIS